MPPRETGTLNVDPEVASLLAEIRLLERVDVVPELDVDRVRDAERGLGLTLPDDVLAVFAAAVPRLADRRGFDLAKIVGHTGVLRALGVRGDLVAVGESGRETFFCVEKGRAEEEGRAMLVVWDAATREGERRRLVDWLRGEVAAIRSVRHGAPRVDAALGSTFRPRLVRRLPEGSSGQRVRHKTFGEGFVLREMGTGPNRKVQVDFPGRGSKLLQARFLEYLE